MGGKLKLFASTAMASGIFVGLNPALAKDPTPFTWTGCYIGLNAGGLSATLGHNVILPAVAGGPPEQQFGDSASGLGFIGGAQVGCNQQFYGDWVVGVEGDLDYANRSHSFNTIFDASSYSFSSEDSYGPGSISARASLRWLGTFRGRFGYAFWNRDFIFVTGGLAFGRVNASTDASVANTIGSPFLFTGSYSAIRTGWVLGAGIEHAFTDRITAKMEYLHFDLGDFNYLVVGSNGGGNLPAIWNANGSVSGNLVRVGLNIKIIP